MRMMYWNGRARELRKARNVTGRARQGQTGAARFAAQKSGACVILRARSSGLANTMKSKARSEERVLRAVRRRLRRHQRLRLRGDRDRAASIRGRSASVYAGRDGIIGALTEDLIDV